MINKKGYLCNDGFYFLSLYMGLVSANAQSNKYDLNEDGDVNITDVIELVNYILGLNNENPGGGGNETDAPEKAIDLGLPSGTKWASCNVGATKPEEYGGYYAWGETEEKETYGWENYIYCNGTYKTCHNIGSDIAGTQYDVAHVKWGGNWRMPTLVQCKELLDNCIKEWTTLNGVKGYKFTSKINGNSIFLPAGGYHTTDLYSEGQIVYCWSSTQYLSFLFYAYTIELKPSIQTEYYFLLRANGNNVRPVWKE